MSARAGRVLAGPGGRAARGRRGGYAAGVLRGALLVVLALAAGCGDEPRRRKRDADEPERARPAPTLDPPERPRALPGRAGSDDDLASYVYLVSKDRRLIRFDPRKKGLAAYGLVGRIDCKTGSNPQSMAVDRSGTAWVFYDSRELYRVSTADASCSPTSYRHPSGEYRLGMAFTAAAPGSSDEVLYVHSPDFGLGTIDPKTQGVVKVKAMGGTAELTGGIDGRLFFFDSAGVLSEIDRVSHDKSQVHAVQGLGTVTALAFARYAGVFYVFTASFGETTRVTAFDPKTREERLRDPALDFVVVGAGQSTKVPPQDGFR